MASMGWKGLRDFFSGGLAKFINLGSRVTRKRRRLISENEDKLLTMKIEPYYTDLLNEINNEFQGKM